MEMNSRVSTKQAQFQAQPCQNHHFPWQRKIEQSSAKLFRVVFAIRHRLEGTNLYLLYFNWYKENEVFWYSLFLGFMRTGEHSFKGFFGFHIPYGKSIQVKKKC